MVQFMPNNWSSCHQDAQGFPAPWPVVDAGWAADDDDATYDFLADEDGWNIQPTYGGFDVEQFALPAKPMTSITTTFVPDDASVFATPHTTNHHTKKKQAQADFPPDLHVEEETASMSTQDSTAALSLSSDAESSKWSQMFSIECSPRSFLKRRKYNSLPAASDSFPAAPKKKGLVARHRKWLVNCFKPFCYSSSSPLLLKNGDGITNSVPRRENDALITTRRSNHFSPSHWEGAKSDYKKHLLFGAKRTKRASPRSTEGGSFDFSEIKPPTRRPTRRKGERRVLSRRPSSPVGLAASFGLGGHYGINPQALN